MGVTDIKPRRSDKVGHFGANPRGLLGDGWYARQVPYSSKTSIAPERSGHRFPKRARITVKESSEADVLKNNRDSTEGLRQRASQVKNILTVALSLSLDPSSYVVLHYCDHPFGLSSTSSNLLGVLLSQLQQTTRLAEAQK